MSLESHIILEQRDPSIVNIQIPDSRDALVIEALTHPHTSIQCNRRRGREIHDRCTESSRKRMPPFYKSSELWEVFFMMYMY